MSKMTTFILNASLVAIIGSTLSLFSAMGNAPANGPETVASRMNLERWEQVARLVRNEEEAQAAAFLQSRFQGGCEWSNHLPAQDFPAPTVVSERPEVNEQLHLIKASEITCIRAFLDDMGPSHAIAPFGRKALGVLERV